MLFLRMISHHESTRIILLTGIMFTYSPLYAAILSPVLQTPDPMLASASLPEHKQIIYQYIDQLRTIQNRTYQLIQTELDNPIQDIFSFKTNINLVNNDAEALRRKILDYQTSLLSTTFQYRNVLLLLNALNYTKNALFELELLSVTPSNVERARLLEDLFRSRAAGINTLNMLENLVTEIYN